MPSQFLGKILHTARGEELDEPSWKALTFEELHEKDCSATEGNVGSPLGAGKAVRRGWGLGQPGRKDVSAIPRCQEKSSSRVSDLSKVTWAVCGQEGCQPRWASLQPRALDVHSRLPSLWGRHLGTLRVRVKVLLSAPP